MKSNFNKSALKKAVIFATACACMVTTLSFGPSVVKAEDAAATTVSSEETTVATDGRTVSHYDLRTDGGTWDGTHYYLADGSLAKDVFFCDGTYTYYLQADGTAMTNRLTYHPDGTHLIYFDANGHELFDQFQYCQDVGYTCYFNTYGYAYFDQVTFVGSKAYYLNATGKMEQSGWFQYANGADYGYANGDGTLMTGGFSYDPYGRVVYYQWNGKVARGLISDGAYYYNMDSTDGHLLGQFAVSASTPTTSTTTTNSNSTATDLSYDDFNVNGGTSLAEKNGYSNIISYEDSLYESWNDRVYDGTKYGSEEGGNVSETKNFSTYRNITTKSTLSDVLKAYGNIDLETFDKNTDYLYQTLQKSNTYPTTRKALESATQKATYYYCNVTDITEYDYALIFYFTSDGKIALIDYQKK